MSTDITISKRMLTFKRVDTDTFTVEIEGLKMNTNIVNNLPVGDTINIELSLAICDDKMLILEPLLEGEKE